MNVQPGLPVSVDGVSDPKIIANTFKEHFSVRSPLGPACLVLNNDLNNALVVSFNAKDVTNAIRVIDNAKMIIFYFRNALCSRER